MEQPLDMGLLKSGMLFRNMTDGELLDVLEAMHARRQVFPVSYTHLMRRARPSLGAERVRNDS